MQENLFREKTLEKVKSPDNLGEYIRVASPGVWVLMASMLALLLGIACWGIFGNVRTVVTGSAVYEDSRLICRVSDEDAAKIRPGMKVIASAGTGTVAEVRELGGNESLCILTMPEDLAEGGYDVEIEIEVIHPMDFLLN